MNANNAQQIGGLVLKTSELLTILNEPDTVGLAFGLSEAGECNNVDLLVYRVFSKKDSLFGELRTVNERLGAESYASIATNVDLFQFEYLAALRTCRFDFSFLEKSIFERLVKDGEPEVFISGVVQDHGNLGKVKGEWFTFKIMPRKEVLEGARSFGGEPDHFFMPPCPPIWTRDVDTTESITFI